MIPTAYIWGNNVWIIIGTTTGLKPKYIHADIALGIVSSNVYTREEIMAYTNNKVLACESLLDLYEIRRTGRGTVREE